MRLPPADVRVRALGDDHVHGGAGAAASRRGRTGAGGRDDHVDDAAVVVASRRAPVAGVP